MKLADIRRRNKAVAGGGWPDAYASVNGMVSDGYVSEPDFYIHVEPFLNHPGRASLYSDKNMYDRLALPNLPVTLARIMKGRIIGPDYRPLAAIAGVSEALFKPSTESGGGVGVEFVRDVDHRAHELARGSSDWIIQKPIIQAAEMSRLNHSSVNTIRVMTLRTTRGVVVVSSVVRIGRLGQRVDNQRAGGVAVGINEGRLRRCAFDKYFNSYVSHPDNDFAFEGYELPMTRDAELLCSSTHETIPNLDLLSWDIAIDENYRLVLIEVNVSPQEINFHQLCNGPVFKDLLSVHNGKVDIV